ncbi:hypothetical protein CRG98_037774 [Punica granatum]|uniref:Uncharacterized protein n=1 Tax=Punica granatum TaxID=22663 RepID=A0A2I0ICX0_PUNGR|nr:hypothetical protein CRG98_037774 [Punica granatum]
MEKGELFPFRLRGAVSRITGITSKQELWQTLIPESTGYIGAPSPEVQSHKARHRPPAIQNRSNDEAGFLQTNKHLPHATTTPQPYKRHSQATGASPAKIGAASSSMQCNPFSMCPIHVRGQFPGSIPTFEFLSGGFVPRVVHVRGPSRFQIPVQGSVPTFKFLSGVRPLGPSRFQIPIQGSVSNFKFMSGVRPDFKLLLKGPSRILNTCRGSVPLVRPDFKFLFKGPS